MEAQNPPLPEPSATLTTTLTFDHALNNAQNDVVSVAEVKSSAGSSGLSLIGGGEKRKRGRPPRGVAALPKATEEEDVCFICFDGGSLVLCDKRGCPKAYHPTCIKRDEAFFRSKAKWNCGWHICSVCQKASHYMCYTCTYSLCKGCTMDADYVGVRGNMGFCSTCMRTIMLIENKDQANKELVQVDFDDKTSWEYLFKMYWNLLKARLSLTLDELTQAENPCKGVRSLASKRMLPDLQHGANSRNGFFPNTSFQLLDSKDAKDLVEPTSKDLASVENPVKDSEKLSNENYAADVVCDAWASKELLDFVAHMKDGDTSTLSEFGVQELLLEYIRKNNLRDPLKKGQIICDSRLLNLFGKTRVGHIEMLKLLEFHFLVKEESQNTFIPAGIVGADASDFTAEENNKSALLTNKNKQRKSRKRIEVKTPQNNLDEYAAIDVHNINLIYLRRYLMENLTQEEKFREKVIGSVVRIRISSSDQKQDIYRLVQVVGTNKAPAPYKVGNKTVDVVLEVLNLDKKEVIAIDAISNQEFSQDECRRLRQSIRCGLVKHLTVGDIQRKAMELLTVRLDDCLEAEKLKLNHLRDRASEKGRKKDLRECVEKLQLLDTPGERQRRLSEIPEIHADPKMKPDYESEPDVGLSDQKQDEYLKSKPIGFGRSNHRQNGKRKAVQDEGLVNGQRAIARKKCASNLSSQAVVRIGPETPAATLATGSSSPVNDGETEKLWHYRDPNGNIQGPFSMVQLRKWSTTGYFPPDMSIWRNNGQKESIPLTDALNAHLLYNTSLQPKQIQPASDNQISDAKWNHRIDRHKRGANQIVQPLQFPTSGVQLDNNEQRRIDVSGSMSSGLSASSYRHNEIQPKDLPPSALRHPLPSSNNSPPASNHHGVVGYGNVGSPSGPCEKKASKPAIQVVAEQPGEIKSNKNHQDQSSGQNVRSFPINLNSSETELNSGSPLASAGSCRETCNTEPRESPHSPLKGNSEELEIVTDVKSQSLNPNMPPQVSVIPCLPSPTPEIPNENQEGQIVETKQPSNSMFQDSSPTWSNSSTLVIDSTQLPDKTTDWGGHSPTPAKPIVDWGDHATPASNNDIPEHNSPSRITSNVTSWHGVETIEFTTLGEESVSDLLAEVDAMESRSGLLSPTSAMRCEDEMKGFRNDCFSIDDDLNLTLDPGKGDAWSSTGDIQVPYQLIAANDTFGVSGSDAYDPLKRSSRHSSTSSDGETRSADFSHMQAEAGSASHPANNRLEVLVNIIDKTRDHMNPVVEPLSQRVADVSSDSNLRTGWGNLNMDRGTISGYGSDQWDLHRRHPSSRDWPSQGGGEVEYDRGKLFENRQQVGGGGGFSRPPLKGQRVCKFYENGHCKKGASCGYLHP